MNELLPIQFDRPGWLLLLVLIIPTFLLARRSIGGLSRAKATVTFAFRVVVILLLAVALAQPIWEKRGEGLTVTVILDRSQSVPLPLQADSLKFMKQVVEQPDEKAPEDRVATIVVARDANISAMPDRYSTVTQGQDVADRTATNLAAAIDLALAIMPDDTANRIVLVSDGNETENSVLDAAEVVQANKVPIDVVLLKYEHDKEVIFDRIVAPARARMGQSANVKLVLRSQSTTSGTVFLTMDGEPLDLNGGEPGNGMHVELEPGPMVIPVTVSLDAPGPVRFNATFEPDDIASDRIVQNNSAVAVTFVGSEGKVLVVQKSPVETDYLVDALHESEIATDRKSPSGIGGLLDLSAYDAIVLANIPRWDFDDQQVRDLHAYVHDLGGGLVMLGGPESFGAGGWIDTDVAKALPVRLDPPQTRQMVRGALALVMHSCEMPQGNFWGQRVAQAAIEALSSLDYCGIVEFNWQAAGGQQFNGCSWAFPMQIVGDKSGALAATKKMVVGDMPDFASSMQLGLQGLNSVRAGQKHMIIISDGDPSPPSKQLVQSFVDAQITVTTVMVAGHGSVIDRNNMKYVADTTGGTFYNITNPKNLPQIFIKEAQLVSRSLIQEDTVQPQVVSRLPGPIEGFSVVPPIDGYVLTAPRDGLAQVPIVNATSEGNDPIYAHWNYGLGKSIAYTSDLTGRWGGAWVSWPEFQSFWEQSIRWVMRPSSPQNMIVNTRVDGERAIVEVEALEGDASFLDFLQTQAMVIDPSSNAKPLDLQQTGPGRYRGEFRVNDAGAYLVNIRYAGGSPDAPIQGNMQAAVTVPYSREFRAVKHNAALLQELAERTGGRMLEENDPALVDLFDRANLEVPKSPKYIWDLLTIIAASLFLLDVAARRLTIDPKWIAALFGRAVRAREDATTQAVSAWKRAKAHSSVQRPAAEASDEDAKAARTRRFEASEDDEKHAYDVGAERPKDVREGRVTKPRPAQSKPGPDEDEGDFTSRLLAAKRRARQDKEPGDGPEGKGGGDG